MLKLMDGRADWWLGGVGWTVWRAGRGELAATVAAPAALRGTSNLQACLRVGCQAQPPALPLNSQRPARRRRHWTSTCSRRAAATTKPPPPLPPPPQQRRQARRQTAQQPQTAAAARPTAAAAPATRRLRTACDASCGRSCSRCGWRSRTTATSTRGTRVRYLLRLGLAGQGRGWLP